jgi:hypothetical protein
VAPDEPERPEFLQWLLYGEATLLWPIEVSIGAEAADAPEYRVSDFAH